MTRSLRPYLALLLAAILALTSQSMAVARGATVDAAGQIVLCTGTGPVAVYVDADGQPVDPPHICPDCALHLLAAVAAPDIVPAPLPATMRKQVVAARAVSAHRHFRTASARAPPAGA